MSAWFFLQIARLNGFTTQGFDRPGGLSTQTSFVVLVGTILNWFLGFVGTLAFLMFVWAGFSYMLSRGQGEKVKKAKTIMTYAVTGIVIILLAYAAVTTITNYLDTGSMYGNAVPVATPVVPVAVPVSPRSGTAVVNPTSLGNPTVSAQPRVGIPTDSRVIQVNPNLLITARPVAPIGDGQANPGR